MIFLNLFFSTGSSTANPPSSDFSDSETEIFFCSSLTCVSETASPVSASAAGTVFGVPSDFSSSNSVAVSCGSLTVAVTSATTACSTLSDTLAVAAFSAVISDGSDVAAFSISGAVFLTPVAVDFVEELVFAVPAEVVFAVEVFFAPVEVDFVEELVFFVPAEVVFAVAVFFALVEFVFFALVAVVFVAAFLAEELAVAVALTSLSVVFNFSLSSGFAAEVMLLFFVAIAYLFIFGSSASRRPSPIKLNASTAKTISTPEGTHTHGLYCNTFTSSVIMFIIVPHAAYGALTPSPK